MNDNRPSLFRFCPRCGREGLAPQDKSAVSCQACGFFYHINPALAAGVFIHDPLGRVLWIRRAKNPGKGKLGLPGGFVDAGETAEAALRREIREEVGLEVPTVEFLASFPNEYPFRGIVYDTLDLFFTCRVESFEGAKPCDEVDSLAIMKPEEVSPGDIAFVSIQKAARLFQARIGH